MDTLRGKGRISEKMLADTLADMRVTMLDADVALPVVDSFLAELREAAAGIKDAVIPERQLLLLIRERLLRLLGSAEELSLRARPPAVVLLVGLQGVGKTTTAGKLALLLRQKHKKRVLLASCDARRPAAVRQLQVLAEGAGVEFCEADAAGGAESMVKAAMEAARKKLAEVLVIDSAGRSQTDQELMQELARVHGLCKPVETLFVVDSAMGQAGLGTAAAFAAAVPITGVALTRVDGDSRGGVALSVRHVLSKPIKFIGTGEKLEALESFAPESFVDRLLGRGDLAGLAQSMLPQAAAAKAAPSRKKGLGFSEMAEQFRQIQQAGGVAALAEKLPSSVNIPDGSDKRMTHMLAIIDSMTAEERLNPQLLDGSRRKRLARGSGTSVQLVNQLLKLQKGGSKMYKKMRGMSPQSIGRFFRNH